MSSWPLPHLDMHSILYSPGLSGATRTNSFIPSFRHDVPALILQFLDGEACESQPGCCGSVSVPLCPVILNLITSFAFTVMTGSFCPGTLNLLSLIGGELDHARLLGEHVKRRNNHRDQQQAAIPTAGSGASFGPTAGDTISSFVLYRI